MMKRLLTIRSIGIGLGNKTGDKTFRRRRHGLAKARPDLFY